MDKLNIKSLFIIIVLLLIGIVGLIQIQRRARPAAAWFSDAWQYRKAITLTNSGAGETNVYVSLTIGTSDATRFQTDGGDIRFTKLNGELLPYYIVSGAGTSSTVIHINFDVYPAGTSKFYLYYGNPSAQDGFSSADFATAASNSSTSNGSEEQSEAPIAYWKFDEGVGTTVHDSSSNQNNGVLGAGTSAPTWQTEDQCISGKCLKYDGINDSVNMGTGNNFLPLSTFSICTWIKSPGLATGMTTNGVLSITYGLIIDLNSSGKFVSRMDNGSNVIDIIAPSNSLYDNKFHYLCVTYDGANRNLFIDGIGKTSVPTTWTGSTRWSNETAFGADVNDYNVNRFNGWIDDTKIYAYARTATQIKQDYRAGLAGQKSAKGVNVAAGSKSAKSLSDGLVGYWKMDEGVGTSLADSSGIGYTATFATGNSAPEFASGKFGIGISFDGIGDYINFGNPNLSSLTNATISFWRKGPSTPANWLLFQGQSSVYYIMATSGGTGNFYHSNAGGNKTIYVDGKVVLAPPSDNNWHYYVISGVNLSSWTTFLLNNYSNWHFKGAIDEIRLYNRPLSQDEVNKLYEYAPGPLFHWDFNEKTGTTAFDKSGNTNLPITNATHTTGKIDGALQFNGDGWLSSSITPSIGAGHNYSQCLWFYPTTSGVRNLLIDDNNRWEHWIAYQSNQTVVGCFYNAGQVCANSVNKAKINDWNHVCFTVENGVAQKIYLNGILENTNTNIGGTLSKIYDDVVIGASGADHQDKFTGKIDEVKIYNYARTQKQILQDMGTQAVGQPAKINKPILWLKLNEGVGRTITNFGSIGTTINGYFVGNTTPTWIIGREGKGLSFDGLNAHFNVYNHNDLKINGQDKTISVWFNHSSTDDGGYILSKPWHGSGGYNWGIRAKSNSRINLEIGASTSWSISPTATYNRDVWNHLVVSIQNPNVKIYLNGKKISDSNHTITNWSPNGEDRNVNLAIACLYPYDSSSCNSTTSAFGGLLDEVKIYNYALSENEIKQDYNQGSSAVIGKSNQTIGGTTTSLDYCIPGDTSPCAAPVGEWRMEEGVGTTAFDTSGNNLNGVLINSPTWSIGKIGKAITFNGATVRQGINISDNSLLKMSNSFTLNAWIKTSQTGSWKRIVTKRGSAANWYSMAISSNKVVAEFYGSSGNYNRTGTKNVNDGLWHYISTQYDSTNNNINIFVDGMLDIGYTNVVLGSTTNAEILEIGKWGSEIYDSGSFTGQIDQVKIYNYARTPAQIAYDYNKGAPIAHWKLDECQGSTVYDSSGLGNTGTITIGAGGSQVSLGTCGAGDTTAWSNGSTGKINSAMSFDGTDDWIPLSDSNFPTGASDRTVTAWFKSNDITSSNRRIFGYGTWDVRKAFDIIVSGSKLYAISHTTNLTGIKTLSSNIWYHVAAIMNNGTITTYINGVVDTSGNFSTINTTLTGTGYIGLGASSNASFNGLIDDVRIYNYALTAEQVKQVYNGGAVNFR